LRIVKIALWSLVSLCAAASFAIVVGIVHPAEKVNALWIVTAAVCIYALAYRFYSAFLSAKIFCLDDNRITPAIRLRDGMDYDPTNKWVLFGHHFAAIAGAGPLIGPVLAAQFGYLPGFLWIIIGSVCAGAVHDMVILAGSTRRNGKSFAHIAKEEIGPVGGMAASIAVLFIIIVALAGLGLNVVNALAKSPWGTFTIATTIPVALFMGFYMKTLRPGKVGEVSVIGFALLIGAVIAGHFIPGSFLEPLFTIQRNAMVVLLVLYGFCASILPIWMLLCPRDYLSTYMKLGTVALLAVGILIMHPSLSMPAYTIFTKGNGPVIPGKLFPFMFITIACGAISGFHALISSGTTPKMIMKESNIRIIGYGAMLFEGFVSIMALIAATILIPGDYFAINTKLSPDVLAHLGFPIDQIKNISTMVGVNVEGRPGGAVSLAVGMASIFSHLPGMKSLMPYWYNFALMFEALFILTTVDAGTRVARFLLQEMGGKVYAPLTRNTWMPGVVVSSMVVVAAWGYLIYTGNISTIWPMFGVANQLLSAIALGLGTTLIIKSGKLRYAWVTFIPMLFMFTTTFTAAWQLTQIFWVKSLSAVVKSDKLNLVFDAGLVVFMAVLAAVFLADVVYKWYGYIALRRPMNTSEVS
jgi:carbon starvation protein